MNSDVNVYLPAIFVAVPSCLVESSSLMSAKFAFVPLACFVHTIDCRFLERSKMMHRSHLKQYNFVSVGEL